MSLHLGNLPPRIQKDALVRIFCRFGRCTVQLKDDFGFAVFDFRADAEKAFRALKGRRICGERIYLSWSRKQPKLLTSATRTDRSRDMKYGRTSGRVGNTMNNTRQDDGRARQKIEEVSDGGFNHNNEKLKTDQPKEEFSEEDGYIDSNQDNGKQALEVENLQNANCDDKQMLLDKSNSVCHVTHVDSMRSRIKCFKCGSAGHKMRDCSLEDAFPGKSLYHSGRKHENETISKSRERGDVRVVKSRFMKRPQPHSRNSRPVRQNEVDGKPSYSKRNRTNARSIPIDNMSTRTNRKDYNGERQRETREIALSHVHSEQTSPQLGKYSRPLEPSSNYISRSRSAESPVIRSLSRRSRSMKISSVKSKSRSGASSPSSSLSTSIDQSSPLSPNMEEIELNGSFGGPPNPQLKEELAEVNEESERYIVHEKVYTDDSCRHLEGVLSESQQLELNLEGKNATSINHAEGCVNVSLEGRIPESQQVLAVKNSPQIGDVPLQSDDISFALEMKDVIKMNDNSSSIVPISCKVKVPSISFVEKRRETDKLENGNDTEMMESLETPCELDPKSPPEGHVGHLGISGVELCMVLKHYGLKYSENDELKLSAEDCFGSARLWPWQLIYYMRLKKRHCLRG